ncbi:AAA family ATPase, partial [Microcoleus sp. A2-C5]
GTRTLVYQAIRTDDQLPVIIKLLKNEYPTFSELVQFRNQYTIAKNLNSPLIIQTYSLEPYQNGYALVMEDFGGISLSAYLQVATDQNQLAKSLSLAEFLNLGIQLTDILNYLSQNRVIHKDIKPANILINPDTKQIKLIDFSISSLLPRETQEIQNLNVLEGTLAYLSPEQTGRMNRGIDYRSDFYALGVTFYQLLTGQLPFISDDAMELVHCHLAKQSIPIHQINSKIPIILSQMISKLMAKNAEHRYQSALGLKHDLEICLAQLEKTGNIDTFKLGLGDITDRFLIPEKLYGRKIEVDNLLAAFERVANPPESPLNKGGHRGVEMMLVAGFSGIGKTAVVNEVHKPIVRQRGYFIKGKYDQFQRNIPFSAFLQAFRDLMGQLLSESDTQLQIWKSKILTAVGDNGQVLIDVIPELERIIGKQQIAPELSGNAAQNRFNMLMQKFVQVFTQAEHPLVMFLDDLQWVDSASLKLLQLLMEDTGHLLVLGAYRDNEVSPTHPFILTVDDIQKTGATVNIITLAPLQKDDINQLISDTLSCEPEISKPLKKLVYQKTQGNPFFATQFLKALHDDGLITFDPPQSPTPSGFPLSRGRIKEGRQGGWQCDIAQIKALALTDDVVEFMALQLQKLPIETQDILKLAACIGAQFDLATLAIVSEKSPEVAATALWKSLQEGLIIPTTEAYKFFTQSDNELVFSAAANPTYRFLHDRVQQAAYSLIPEDQKQATHLKIGQLLLQNSSEIEPEEKLFDIVGHLNLGIESIEKPSEREALAQLNLKAGRKARSSTAYTAARIYLQIGIDLLTINCWVDQYELTLNLYVASAEAAYLNADFDGMEKMAEQVLQKAQTILDKVKIYEISIGAQTAQSQMLEAIAIGRDALEQLGVKLPTETDETKIGKALQNLASQLQGRRIEELVDLPMMSDATTQAAIQLLGTLFPPVFLGMPGLLPVLSSRMVSLSIEFGNAPASTVGYAIHGMVLCAFLGDVETGYSFGKLAMNVLNRFNVRELNATIPAFFGSFIQHHQEPIRATIPTLKGSYTAAIETGNFLQSGYSILNYLESNLFGGVELENWETEITTYSAVMAQAKQYSAQAYFDMMQQTVNNLRKVCILSDCLIGPTYDETVMLPKHHQNNELTAIAKAYVYKLLLAYSFGNNTSALDYIAKTQPYLMAISGLIQVPIFHFYAALTHLAIFPTKPEQEPSEILALVETHQTTLHQWAKNAPMNYLHKWYLVEAEKYRILGNKADAIELYDHAISLAQENQFLNEEGLANELTAKFYLNWGKEKVAQAYMIEAYYCYARWGAKAKVIYLEKRYPQLLDPLLQQSRFSTSFKENITRGTIASSNTSSSAYEVLDLATMFKASQVISGEMELDKLLTTLLQIVVTNAGASKCVLLLKQDTELQVAAFMEEGQEPQILPPMPLESSQDVAIALVNTVKRSLKPLVLVDARVNAEFCGDRYIAQHQPKSVLCSPILNQGKLIGILYLENNLTVGAFTSDRVELLNLLCAQAAISLENARLYENSQKYTQQLAQSLAKLQASEIRFQNLANNIPGTVYQLRLGADGSISTPYVSSGCFDLYELAPELVMSGVHSLNAMHHPDDDLTITQVMIASGQNLTPFEQEWRIIVPSGIVKWVCCAARPARQADGAILWDGVVIDISDRKRAELAVQQKTQDLAEALTELQNAQLQIVQSEKMSALGNLVAGVAHEMNNPLGFISASLHQAKPTFNDILEHLELYQETLTEPTEEIIAHAEEIDLNYSLEDFPKVIDAMSIACDRLSKISTSLRTFSRADRDHKVLFNIHEGIDSTILILKHRLKANDQRPAIEVITNYGNLPQIECFPGQLNQVFMNILANAIDALDESNVGRSFQSIKANLNRITVTTSTADNFVKITISDNGNGMSEELKQKIFDHLFTTKAVGKGTGLGLAIARQIVVETHGGTIEVNSDRGSGTEFAIFLPVSEQN